MPLLRESECNAENLSSFWEHSFYYGFLNRSLNTNRIYTSSAIRNNVSQCIQHTRTRKHMDNFIAVMHCYVGTI